MLGLKLATGLGMMVLTIVIHALFMMVGVKVARKHKVCKARFLCNQHYISQHYITLGYIELSSSM